MHVRWMIRRDMPVILALENGTRNEWAESDYISNLRRRNCIAMVVEDVDGKVLGAVCYELHKHHYVILHVVGEAVEILKKITTKLVGCRRTRIHASVHPDDIEIMAQYCKAGFRQTGHCDWRYILLAPVLCEV